MDWGGPCQNFVSTEPTPGLSYLYLSAVIDRDLSRESSLPTQFVSDDTTGSRTEQLNQPTSLSAATWEKVGRERRPRGLNYTISRKKRE